MLAVTHPEAILKGREVIVAIIGGVMLTLALTRPRLRWMERLTDGSDTARVWSERGLTLFSLAMAGYAYITVRATLHGQLDSESDSLLRGAALFLIGYAWLVHFEPFAREWQLRGGIGACLLYTSVMLAMIVFGGVLAGAALTSSIPGFTISVMAPALGLVLLCWLFYRALPTIMAYLVRTADHRLVRVLARVGLPPVPSPTEESEPPSR
jgi:hypothetical protein